LLTELPTTGTRKGLVIVNELSTVEGGGGKNKYLRLRSKKGGEKDKGQNWTRTRGDVSKLQNTRTGMGHLRILYRGGHN